MIKVYEIPTSKWNKMGQPSAGTLEYDSRVIASGFGQDYEQALKELVMELNDDAVDIENCYLYIEETED